MITIIKTILEVFDTIEPVVSLPAIVLSIYLYFRDPLKRWIFWGYLPTAVIVLFDPDTEKVLLVTNKGTLGFPQGGIFGSDTLQTVEQTLKRELSVDISLVEIRYAKPLGTVKIMDTYRTKRVTLGSISLFNKIKGKGYVAYFVAGDLKKIKRKIRKGYDLDKYEIVSIDTALKQFKKTPTAKNTYLISALAELKNYLKLKN